MCSINEEHILEWINQCDSQLKQLLKAKYFIHIEYYKNDSISYHVEEDMSDEIDERIRDIQSNREFLSRMLYQINIKDVVEMFDYQFPDNLVNQLPANLRKAFYNFVYEM